MYTGKVYFFKDVIGPVYLKDTATAILSSQCITSYVSFTCFAAEEKKDILNFYFFFRIFDSL